MKKVFYYADLDLTVVLVDGRDDFLNSLTVNESLGLQSLIWLTISGFLTTRALYLQDTVKALEKIEQAGKHNNGNPDGEH